MKIKYYRKLNKNETYPVSLKQVKSSSTIVENTIVVFGLNRIYNIDSRCSKRPKIMGKVIASVSCDRSKNIYISFYPVSREAYDSDSFQNFINNAFPIIEEWIHKQIDKPDTSIVGIEELIVDWTKQGILYHKLRYL